MNYCCTLVLAFSAVLFVWVGKTVPFWTLSVLLFWCAVSSILMMTAYLFQQPVLVMGKSRTRSFCVLVLVLNFPFLVAYWLIWFLRHGFSEHAPVHQIQNTNVSVSQWPIFSVPLDNYDVVFDLTSEMPAIYRVHDRYVSLPNLDGTPLCQWEIPSDINRNQRILVHCAQGRGRSAVYAAMLLKKLGYAPNADTAYEQIKQSRPRVHLTKAQLNQLRHHDELTKNRT